MIGLGATLNERFILDEELGQGGMGTVYRATDRLLGRNVAIKLLKESGAEHDAEKIRLEAQILARLVHDKIVRLYDFGASVVAQGNRTRRPNPIADKVFRRPRSGMAEIAISARAAVF